MLYKTYILSELNISYISRVRSRVSKMCYFSLLQIHVINGVVILRKSCVVYVCVVESGSVALALPLKLASDQLADFALRRLVGEKSARDRHRNLFRGHDLALARNRHFR